MTLSLLDGDFEITFNAAGITLNALGNSIFRAYEGNLPTDFTNGAYAFAGAFLNRDGAQTSFDLLFSGPGTPQAVPAPGSLALLLGGIAAIGLARRRRRTAPAD